MKTNTLWYGAAAATVVLVGCGGGGGGYTAPITAPAGAPTATVSPTPAATATATAPASTTLATSTLLGTPGFVTPQGRTVYVLSNDTTTNLACTVASGCTGVWPVVAPPNGVALSTGFTVYTRSDDGASQLAYNGHPLYTYAGDTAGGQVNGNGIVSFGGTWTVARP